MNKTYIILTMLAAFLLCACDDGRIEEKEVTFKEGRTVNLKGTLHGVSSWTGSSYYLAFAGFDNEDQYAIISKIITSTGDNDQVEITLSGIDEEVTQVELCVLNRLRQRVMTFQQMDITEARNAIDFEVGEQDVSGFDAIQYALFDQSCTACHGGSGRSAAGLDLTAGKSYAALINKPSTKITGLNLVTPGDAGNSVLSQVLNSDVSATWRQNHADMLNKDRTANLLDFINQWINDGAGTTTDTNSSN